MRRRITTALTLIAPLFFCATLQAQTFTATQNGAWNVGTTWGGACSSGCVAGTDYPGATNDVFTKGKLITVSSAATCRNLFVSYNVSNSITLGTLRTIIVTGTLSGWDDAAGAEEFPTVSVISFGTNASLTFTAANIQPAYDPYVIYFWDSTIPIGRAIFNFGSGVTKNTILPLTFSSQLRVQSGTLSPDLGASYSGNGTAALTIDAGAALTTSDLIDSFASATINGTVTTTSYLNISGGFTLNSTGVFNTAYNNASGGWWSATAPSAITINSASTVNFNKSGAQNVFPMDYGNVTVSGTGTITKTIVGSGTFNVQGNLSISSSGITFNTNAATGITIGGNITNNGSWTPTDDVNLNGAGAQSIGGSSSINFSGGLTVNKSAGTATLAKAITVSNGITVTAGTLDLGSQTVTLSSGNIDNSGTITPSSSTVSVGGTTSVVGTSTTSLNNLTITSSGNFTGANGMSVNGVVTNGGTLNAPTGGTMSIGGNFTNNNTFNSNNGTLTFNGAADQLIAGTVNVNNVNISNATNATAYVNGNMNLSGILTITSSSSTFDADGNAGNGVLTLKSTSVTSGGRIAAIPSTGSFADVPVTIERYIDSPDNWRYLSMPITSGTANSWKTGGFYVTGNFTNPSTSSDNSNIVDSTSPSIYSWDASAQAWVEVPSSSGAAQATTVVALSNNVGYSAYSYNTANSVVSVRGNIARGTVSSISISSTGGNYNLIPNPHASPIDWDNIQPTVSGLQDQMWLRKTDNSFASYVHGSGVATNGPGGWTGEVAIGQAFWTQSSGGGTSISLAQSAKTNNTSQFLRTEAPTNLVRIALNYGTQKDESVIHFVDGATANYEDGFDAIKRKNGDFDSGTGMNSYVNLSSYNSNSSNDFAINAVAPLSSCSGIVKLKLADTPVGNYSLSFSDMETLNLGYTITLTDHFLSTTVPIQNGDSYSFSVTADALSTGDARFEISTASPSINLVAPTYSIGDKCDPNSIPVSLATQTGVNYQLFSGTTAVGTVLTGTGSSINVQIPRNGLADGVNLFDVKAFTPDNCSAKTYSAAVSVTNKTIPSVAGTTNGSVCTSGSVTLAATGAPTDGSYLWYSKVDAVDPIVGATGASYATPTLSSTTSYYVSALNVFGCASVRKEVVANVFVPIVPTIIAGADTLYSSQKTGNQWFKNGQLIAGATQRYYVVKESGNYSVQTTDVNGCSASSASKVMVVTAISGEPEMFAVYPNPTNDQISISWDNATGGKLQGIHVFDSKGLTVFSSDNNKTILEANDKTISLGSMSSGLYVLKLVSDKGTKSIKIVKK